MGLLALAIAPGFAICIFIYFKDKYNKEPFGLLLGCFLLGALSTLPAIIIELAFEKPVIVLFGNGMIATAISAFLIVGLSEEGSKYLALRLVPFRHKSFDDPFDGIVYAVMVGMGFATLENIGYVAHYGFATGIVRMFLSVPAHACFAVLMGYYVGLAKFDKANRKKYLLLAIFWSVFFHGMFDFFLFLGNTWLHVAGAIISFIVAVRLSLKLIRRKQAISKRHQEGFDDITGNNHHIF